MMEAVDPGIVGVSYQAPMTLQDAENAINYYIEVAEVDGAKEPIALLGTPGLNPLIGTTTGQVRGAWVLPGGQKALVVTGSVLYLVTVQVPATSTSVAQLAVIAVGNLLTNSGQVTIRDNGVLVNGLGGYAVIVDGLYCYYYLLSGVAYTFRFSAGTTASSNVLSLPGLLPNGLIISPSASVLATSGNLVVGTTITNVNTIPNPNITVTLSNAATATNASDTVAVTIKPFGQITDPGFLGAQRIAFIEGWLIFNQPGTRTFFTTGPTPYQLLFPGLFFALKDSSTDNLVTLYEQNRELWLVGERTSEVWYNSGTSGATNQGVVFARVPGVGPQIGCGAWASITRLGESLIWLAKNEQGENVVIRTSQYSWEKISNHAIEYAIASYPVVSDAIGYGYEEGGHAFYVLTFPTADVTWVYDATASGMLKKPCWHQRASFDPVAGVYHRHRGNCYMDFADLRIVGDYQTGQLHQMSRSFYTDAGNPLRAQRRCKHIWKKANRTRIRQSSLQIEFTPGVGLQSGQGTTPQAMLRWSNDGGFTWSNEHWRSIGAAGHTKNRAKWNRLGQARDRIYEVNMSDPVPRDIIGATLFAESED